MKDIDYIIIPLDKELVDDAIHRKILQYRDRQLIRKNEQDILVAHYNADVADGTYLKKWASEPTPAEQVYNFYNNMIEKELKYFSNVFVIELTDMKVDKRFGLAYDKENIVNGQVTGYFSSLDEAANWFFNGGR